ncbi:MAG: hypothetical protein LQ340_006549 [Diploschistes diacapsis]|nr:MAG: hypothetical protein LQ340_006549 [Diploschistes diacapsis]
MASGPPRNILSAGNLARIILFSLPRSAEPQIRNPWDAISLLCHACMLAVDFKLIGLGEDHKIGKHLAFPATIVLRCVDASSESEDPKPLPSEWNTLSASDYAFMYKHSQSSMRYLLKVGKLGNKAVIHGMGLGDDKVASFDVPAKDFVSESSLPFTARVVASDSSEFEALGALQNVFITAGRMGDFSALTKIQLLQKLIPGLQKDGYQESAQAASDRLHAAERRGEDGRAQRGGIVGRGREPRRPAQDPLPPAPAPRPLGDPLAAPPRRPYGGPDFEPPGFEDEHGVLRPPGRGPGERQPLNIGERDLYPPGLGPNDPLRMGGPRGGFRGGGGGMHPTFDDPLFDGRAGTGGGYTPGFDPQ